MNTDNDFRREQELTDGWTFALNSEQEFHPVSLPHDWAIGTAFDREREEGESQGFRSRFGVGWYRRELVLPEKTAGRRYLLSFGGIYEDRTVWVNGAEAGGRKYGTQRYICSAS